MSYSALRDVGQRDQQIALATALSDSLWLAGQEERATVTLVTEDNCITPYLDYKLNNFTEKVRFCPVWTLYPSSFIRVFFFVRFSCSCLPLTRRPMP